MALSEDVFDDHIAHWSDRFRRSAYAYRQHWPERLFRHESIENAAVILRSGRLLSRDQSIGVRVRDIADKDVIASRPFAHRYARLYFRPKNPTQYHIEGVRKPTEFYRGDPDTHAPVLVILIFKARELLCHSGDVHFSNGNMQSPHSDVLATDDDFRNMPFEAIYHAGAFARDTRDDILRARCAEVLVPSPLILDSRLQAVLCRSPAERGTLLYLLGDQAEIWSPRVRVFTEAGIFENKWAYVDAVSVSAGGVEFTLHPRYDAQTIRVDIDIQSVSAGWKKSFFAENINASLKVKATLALEPGGYLVEIKIDGCFAYRAPSLVDELPF